MITRLHRGLLLVLLPFCLCVPALGVVIRHDRADSSYIVEAREYPQLFYLHTRNDNKVCIATLISGRWAITAGHCIKDTPIARTMDANGRYELSILGEKYYLTQSALHPQYNGNEFLQGVDLALIQLDRPVPDVTPVQLNRTNDEQNQIITLLGWGYTGTGTTGRRYNDGKFRRAENRVDESGDWLRISFDDPRQPGSDALAIEGIPGLGDSGGPALLERDQQLLLLGVAVGELEREDIPAQQGVYGAIEIYERISLHLAWIEAVTGQQ